MKAEGSGRDAATSWKITEGGGKSVEFLVSVVTSWEFYFRVRDALVLVSIFTLWLQELEHHSAIMPVFQHGLLASRNFHFAAICSVSQRCAASLLSLQ